MTKVYYKHALDSEKQEIAAQVFSELNIYGGQLANFTAKEGFAALFNRHDVKDGAPTWTRTMDTKVKSLLLYQLSYGRIL